MYPAAAIEVYTPPEVFVENGTTGTLKCSFKSTEVISSQASVSWSFIPEGSPESTGVAVSLLFPEFIVVLEHICMEPYSSL